MSHFSVLVIGDNPKDQLAPYHEFECTGVDDKYVLDVDKTEEFHKEWEGSKNDYSSQVEFADEWYGWSPVKCKSDLNLADTHKYGYVLVNDDGVVEKAIKRTNPQAHWDWYQVGGRWSGMLKLKKEKSGETGSPGFFGSPAKEGYVDQAMKKDVDFDGMYAEAEKEAIETYNLLEKVTAGIDPPQTWKNIREQFGDIDKAREYRHNHPWVKALAGNSKLWMALSDEVEEYCIHSGGRNEYIERERCRAFSAFAVVKDGKWYQEGNMGWWGMVSDEKDKDDWAEQFMSLVADLPDDTLLTIIDCHI